MKPLTGHVPDAPDPRDYIFEPTEGALIGSTVDIDLRKYLPPIRDQIANDCCAHASMAGAFATASALGHPIAFPSVLFAYANARILDAGPGGELRDAGCSIRQLFKSLSGQTVKDSRGARSGLGLIREEAWPEVSESVNLVPPDDLYRDGENATIATYSRVPQGIPAIEGLIGALRRVRFPTLCMIVDQAFADVGGGVYVTAGGKAFGGHAMLVVGYSETAHAFLVRNSWGTDFGDEGYCWIDQGFVANHTSDFWVTNVTPEVLR